MRAHTLLLPLLPLLLASLPLSAATPISETRPADADVHVRIENISGSVTVEPGAGDRVEVTGSLGEGSEPLRFEGDRRRLDIEVEVEDGGGWGNRVAPTELVVKVPAGARIEVNTVSAGVTVTGLTGGDAEIETVSGSIDFRADSGRVVLKSVSGSIDGEGAGRHWRVGTVSGSVKLPKIAGELNAESVSGSLRFDFGQADRVRAETVSGRVDARGTLLADGSLDMQSVSGSLELSLTGSVDARIQAQTFSGRIESAFGTPERSGIGGGQRLDARAGNGSASVRLESFSGRIRIGKD